jgi:hypothetical protein
VGEAGDMGPIPLVVPLLEVGAGETDRATATPLPGIGWGGDRAARAGIGSGGVDDKLAAETVADSGTLRFSGAVDEVAVALLGTSSVEGSPGLPVASGFKGDTSLAPQVYHRLEIAPSIPAPYPPPPAPPPNRPDGIGPAGTAVFAVTPPGGSID